MKKLFYILLAVMPVLTFQSCKDDDPTPDPEPIPVPTPTPTPVPGVETYSVSIKLSEAIKDVEVKLNDDNNTSYTETTNESGVAVFTVPVGVYAASTSYITSANGKKIIKNGTLSQIVVTSSWNANEAVNLSLDESVTNQIVIKELYNAGCPTDNGSSSFSNDQYCILYNNSDQPATLKNICIGAADPSNAQANNKNVDESGNLVYKDQGFIPCWQAIWYYEGEITFEPYEQKVISFASSIDNTTTYSKSVNLANPAYYACYDPDVFTHKKYVVDASIPATQHFKAALYGLGTGWTLSNTAPAFVIFTTEESPKVFATTEANYYYNPGGTQPVNRSVKAPTESIVDGVEVFSAAHDKNTKRLTAAVDAGSVALTSKLGYTIYRNVDKTATEALPENEGKLVYNYSLGTADQEKGSTDPSAIDAEASIKQGAHIIYVDTNNSSNDFHQRKQSSLRD